MATLPLPKELVEEIVELLDEHTIGRSVCGLLLFRAKLVDMCVLQSG